MKMREGGLNAYRCERMVMRIVLHRWDEKRTKDLRPEVDRVDGEVREKNRSGREIKKRGTQMRPACFIARYATRPR